jgi:hypothetical protein
MRRRSTDFAEVPDASTHGDKGINQKRSVADDVREPVRKREAAVDYAPGQLPSEPSYFFRTPSTSAASASTSTAHHRLDKFPMTPPAKDITPDSMVEGPTKRRPRLRDPWACSLFTLATALLGFGVLLLMVHSFMTRQLDTKGCEMCYMRPYFVPFKDFDTEHTRFASKYSLYLYREGGIDEDARVRMGQSTCLRLS